MTKSQTIHHTKKKSAGRRLFNFERKVIKQIINKSNLDIVHALWSYEFAWAALSSNTVSVITLQDHALTMLKYQFDFFRMARFLMNYIVLSKSHFLISNSHNYSIFPENKQNKTRIIPNFYSEDLVRHYSDSLAKGNYIISICNGVGKRKNVQKSILAFSI